MSDTSLTIQQESSSQVTRRASFAPQTLEEAFQFAKMLLESGMVPKSYKEAKPETIVVALQFGMEVGLAPLQALQNIANINGQPSLWGDAALALCKSYPNLFEYIEEQDFETIRQQKFARCTVKRRTEPNAVSRTFSLEEAKRGGLLGKQNVWATYPERMLQMRARAFALRDTFPDILKGLAIAEEVRDYQTVEGVNQEPRYNAAEGTQEVIEAQVDEPIGAVGATTFYQAYKRNGWSRDESARFIESMLGIVKPKDSRDIPQSRYAEAMEWANSRNPAIPENPDADQ